MYAELILCGIKDAGCEDDAAGGIRLPGETNETSEDDAEANASCRPRRSSCTGRTGKRARSRTGFPHACLQLIRRLFKRRSARARISAIYAARTRNWQGRAEDRTERLRGVVPSWYCGLK